MIFNMKRMSMILYSCVASGSENSTPAPTHPIPFSLPPPPPPPPPPCMSTPNSQERMKKVNWQLPAPQMFSEKCFWTDQKDNLQIEKKVLFDGLTKQFSLPCDKSNKGSVPKSEISLKVLDGNSAQNLLISLRVLLRNLSHEQIKQHILRCDTSILNSTCIETLIKFLPKPHKIEELQKLNKQGAVLPDIENFVASIGTIDRIVPRLCCINFKLGFKDSAKELKSDIAAGIAACAEMMSSKKFGAILRYILSIGNLMNKSEAIGFQLEILPKLREINSTNNKQTLLHFIVENVQQKFPELLNFADELNHIDKAARLNYRNIEETIESIIMSSENVEKELQYANASKLPEDKFIEIMTPFLLECCNEVKVLKEMMNELENSYTKVGKYFAFEVGMCPIEECCSNVQMFKTHFLKAYEELCKIHEAKQLACQAQSVQLVDQQQLEPAFNGTGLSMSTGYNGSHHHQHTQRVVGFPLREFKIKLKRLTKNGMHS